MENEDAAVVEPVVKKSVYELKEEISEELKQMQLRVQEQIKESNKKQIQKCRQQNEDFRKYLMDVQIAIDNQTKQQSLLQNLMLDLKNSKIGPNPDNLESEKKNCVNLLR